MVAHSPNKIVKKHIRYRGSSLVLRHVRSLLPLASLVLAPIFLTFFFVLEVRTVFHRYPQGAIFESQRMGVSERVLSVLFSRDPHVLTHLAYYHFGGRGEYNLTLARHYLEKALVLAPTAPLIHFNLARIAFLEGRFTEALLLVAQEERINPTLDRMFYLRGLIYGYEEKYAEAERAFIEFNRRQPDTWAGHVDLGWIYFQEGKYEDAKRVIEEILPYQNNAWLQNSYGLALLNLGEKEKAQNAFLMAQRMASLMTPDDWGVAYGGNDPNFYSRGLELMRRSIDENIALTQ
jgi:tetratricopeptide (TPR) repeat protein